MEKKDTVLLHRKHKIAFDKLSDENKGRLIGAILNYCFGDGENLVADDPKLDMAFSMIQGDIDANARHYEAICEKRREAGRNHRGNQYTNKMEQLEQMEQLSQIGTNGTDNDNDNDNDILLNENDNKEELRKKKRTTTHFKKPTVEEIQAYCSEKGYTISAQRFFDYYESNGWKVGRNPMKDWKAAVRTWYHKDHPSEPSPKQAAHDDGYQRAKKTTSTT